MLVSLLVLKSLIVNRERLKAKVEKERFELNRLHEMDSMKIKFFTNISHELRTPLTLILSPVERMLLKYKGKEDERYLNLIYQNAKRLLTMVNELLDFRKLEVEGLKFNPSMGDIVSFIKATVHSFSDLTLKKNINLLFKTDLKYLDMLFDKDKMEKIMFNLLSNAFKFTPENGQVSVCLSFIEKTHFIQNLEKLNETEYYIEIKVIDTGIGLEADKLEKIFIRFFQINNEMNENGTGIGLSLTQEFVKMHNGDISVDSQIGKGSTFKVVIPFVSKVKDVDKSTILSSVSQVNMTAEMINLGEEDLVENEKQTKNKPLLLIAEDNDDLRFYLKDNLSIHYNVLEAENGKIALAIILEKIPDFIISDIMMPEMDGIELCKLVKMDKSICHIPLILLTAKTSDQQQLEGFANGADDYITKPFNYQILEAKIRNLILLRKNQQKKFQKKLNIEPKDIAVSSLDEIFMQKALDLVEKNIANADFSVEEFSREMGISRMSLYKKTMALTDKSPIEFIRILRLKRAALLLQKSQLTIAEIAFKVGFNDPKYFSTYFKAEFKMLPSQYVKDLNKHNE